jgi:adenylylsulfate kinase
MPSPSIPNEWKSISVRTDPFAVWITGRPSSGKSTLAQALLKALKEKGVEPAILESDELRKVLTPKPRYDAEEREVFYGSMLHIGVLLIQHGVPVIFDATAHLRRYREQARQRIPRFVEVFVDCAREICEQRDPKGLYRRAREDASSTLPGMGVPYEPPLHPEITVRSDKESPDDAVGRIVESLSPGNPPGEP